MSDNLGYDDLEDSINILGIGEFGQQVGMPVVYGVLIGGGVSQVVARGLQFFAGTSSFGLTLKANAKGIGFLAAGAAAGYLFYRGDKSAAVAAVATAAFSTGLEYLLEKFGVLNGLGLHVVENLGLVVPEQAQQFQGLNGPPVNLLGPAAAAGGGKSGLSAHYGATLLG